MDPQRIRQRVLLGALAGVLGIYYYRKKMIVKSRKKRKIWVQEVYQKRKQQGFYDNLIQEFKLSNPILFFNFARMTASSFEKLVAQCANKLQKHSRRESVSPEQRLMVTLRHLATGDSYPSLGYAFRMAPSTISNIIWETCNCIWEVLSPIYLPPLTEEQWLKIAEDYCDMWQLPNCLGAIDGKHIKIQAPSHSGSQYFNYKKYFSTVLLAVCDSKYFFTFVNIGSYGSQSDGGVLRNSSFGEMLRNKTLHIPEGKILPGTINLVPLFFIGDEAFPLLVNLMRPFSRRRNGPMPEDEQVFNYRLSRARRRIENAFGIMVARFRIYHRTINAAPETVDAIVKATVCLHNYIKCQQENMYCPGSFVDREINGQLLPGEWRRAIPLDCAFQNPKLRFGNRSASREAWEFRNYLKDYLYSATGNNLCPWQLSHINENL